MIFSYLSIFILFLSPPDAQKVGELIWKNECAGSIEGLTHWNKGENFGSFGIGHFIWYPKGVEQKFQETFPDLLKFIQSNGVSLPLFLKKIDAMPWISKEQFEENKQSPEMIELRQFLFETRGYQTSFIILRLEKTLPEMTAGLSKDACERVKATLLRLQSSPNGIYALIDYANFKGMGISPSETYKGQGWGLLQVLLKMPENSQNVVADFSKTAAALLTMRVQNAPPERMEERWLKGWLNRVDSYINWVVK